MKKRTWELVGLLALVLCFALCTPALATEGEQQENSAKDSILSILANASQIVLAVVGFFGVFTYFRTSNKTRATMALDLVKRYMEVVIPVNSFIMHCIDKGMADQIINELEKYEPLYFSYDGANKIFKEQGIIEQYNKLFVNIDISKINKEYLARQFQLRCLDTAYETIIEAAINSGDEEKYREILDNFIRVLVVRMKNELEYFAMGFLSVGDIKLVYSSIHQTYLKFCRFYYLIFVQENESNYEKYYTKVEKLYNKWNKKSKQTKITADKKTARHQEWLNRQK